MVAKAMSARILTLNKKCLSTSSIAFKGGYGMRQGGGGHPSSRPTTRIRQRQNHLMTRKTVIETRGEQDKIPCPCGRRYMNRHNVCNSCYTVTKYETERLVSIFRRETGLDFPVEEVNFKFDPEKNEYTTYDAEAIDDSKLLNANFSIGQSIYNKREIFEYSKINTLNKAQNKTKVDLNHQDLATAFSKITKNEALKNRITRENLDIPEPYHVDDDLVVPHDLGGKSGNLKDEFLACQNSERKLFGLDVEHSSKFHHKKATEKTKSNKPLKSKDQKSKILEPNQVGEKLFG